LGQDFTTRGRRQEEQVALLRRLWTEPTVTFAGRWDQVTGAGLAPLPVQRPIPVWFGGSSERAYDRIGRLADGWFPQVAPGDDLDAALARIGGSAREAGRDPVAIGMEGRVTWGAGGEDEVAHRMDKWRVAGASHVTVNTMRAGFATVDDHVDALTRVASVLGLAGAGAAR
jgi:alkanesulfonate monooxygenase SsuD/methylene tetrahydromethanopterin reductase-like flavin-dependent oxidoreductase (luciferase family)